MGYENGFWVDCSYTRNPLGEILIIKLEVTFLNVGIHGYLHEFYMLQFKKFASEISFISMTAYIEKYVH